MALNDLGEELFQRPVSIPRLNLPAHDDSEERKELAAKFNEQRIIKRGAEAWAQIARTQSFRAWADVGKALLIVSPLSLPRTFPPLRRSARHCRNGNAAA